MLACFHFVLLLSAALLPMFSGTLQAQSITISPGYTSVGVGGTVQYSATVTGLANTAVTWSVSGIAGGNSTNGTITASGLYTAPAKIPANGVTVLYLPCRSRAAAELLKPSRP